MFIMDVGLEVNAGKAKNLSCRHGVEVIIQRLVINNTSTECQI